jgi:hypothetical protein
VVDVVDVDVVSVVGIVVGGGRVEVRRRSWSPPQPAGARAAATSSAPTRVRRRRPERDVIACSQPHSALEGAAGERPPPRR